MQFSDDVFGAVENALEKHESSRYQYALPGIPTTNGQYQFKAPEKGKIWVRLLNQDGQVTSYTTAVNFGSNLDPKIKVRMLIIDGHLTIVTPSPTDAINAYGERASQAATPPHVGAIGGGNDDYVESQRFIPGLVTVSPLGGMYVRVYKFRHADGHWETSDYEIPSGDIPTGFSESRITLIVVNPSTWTIGNINGALGYNSITTYDDDDIDLIGVPAGYIPLAAVTLYEGQTSVNDGLTRILDARQFLNAKQGATGHVILVDGMSLAQRSHLNFISTSWVAASATDDSGNDETEVGMSLDPSGASEITPIDGANDKIPIWDASANTVGFVHPTDLTSGGGASAFTDLTDVPSSYVGQSGKIFRVKVTEDGGEFVDPATASGIPPALRVIMNRSFI